MKKLWLCFVAGVLATAGVLTACGETPPEPSGATGLSSIAQASPQPPSGISEPSAPVSTPAQLYHDALTTEEIEQAKDAAAKYYESVTQTVENLEHAQEQQYARFLDSSKSYQPGEVIVFVGKDTKSGALRGITLERSGATWKVTNEGF